MYQVDAATGAYTEVSGSPFASAYTNSPTLLATEPTGTYLAVVNSTGLNAGESSVESFQIDSANQALIPVPGSLIELVSTPIGAAANPAFGSFRVYLGPNPASPNPFYQQDGDLLSFTIDPTTGLLGNDDGSAGSTNHGRSFGADPLGRFVVAGQGQFSGLLQVTAADGTQGNLSLGSGIFPQEIFVGPASISFTPPSSSRPTASCAFTSSTPPPGRSPKPPAPRSRFHFHWKPRHRPHRPLRLSKHRAQPSPRLLRRPRTGYLSEVATSPFTGPGFGLPVAFSVDAGAIQPVTGPVATITPPTLSLGSAQVGTPSNVQTVTLSSTGDQALSVNGIGITGANAAEFAESDTCGAPTALAPTHSCFISIVFTPAAAGSRAANLLITDNATGSPQSVPLSGTGTAPPPPAPAITFTPGTLNFPSFSQNATSSPLSVTVTNSGNAALTISSIVLGGNNPADFSSPAGNCIGAPIAPNATCTVTETFTPLAAGARQATLSFTDNAAGSPHLATLTGSGIASPTNGPILKFIPTSVTFPIITQGLASTPMSVTISLDACATATIAANSSCSVSITFSPVFSGPRSETLSVTNDAPGSPQVLNIFANAAPAFALTGTLAASVAAGQTASFNLQLTPATDFNGTLSLACTGAPLHATCMAPSSVVLNTGVPSSLTVSVPTKTNAIALPTNARRTSPRTPAPETITARVSLVAFCLLFLVLYREAAGRQLSHASNLHHRKTVYAASVLALFIPLIFAVNGCGGGASSNPAPQGSTLVTPAGTYTLVITPSASNAAGNPLQLAPFQLTLVVN